MKVERTRLCPRGFVHVCYFDKEKYVCFNPLDGAKVAVSEGMLLTTADMKVIEHSGPVGIRDLEATSPVPQDARGFPPKLCQTGLPDAAKPPERVYNGPDVLSALALGKVLKGRYDHWYRLCNNRLEWLDGKNGWVYSAQGLNDLLNRPYTEVTPP